MTEKEILELKPEFKFGDTIMIDYFKITKGYSFYCIQNGLRHCEEDIKSPYYYEKCIGGADAEKQSLELFTRWWENLNG
jgi:hypothetical protein